MLTTPLLPLKSISCWECMIESWLPVRPYDCRVGIGIITRQGYAKSTFSADIVFSHIQTSGYWKNAFQIFWFLVQMCSLHGFKDNVLFWIKWKFKLYLIWNFVSKAWKCQLHLLVQSTYTQFTWIANLPAYICMHNATYHFHFLSLCLFSFADFSWRLEDSGKILGRLKWRDSINIISNKPQSYPSWTKISVHPPTEDRVKVWIYLYC